MVTAGNGPWWLTTSGASVLLDADQAVERHLRAVAGPGTKMRDRSVGSRW